MPITPILIYAILLTLQWNFFSQNMAWLAPLYHFLQMSPPKCPRFLQSINHHHILPILNTLITYNVKYYLTYLKELFTVRVL